MASPAQVANDLAARAAFWRGRDRDISDACTIGARVIRAYLTGPHPAGHTTASALTRLCLINDVPTVRESSDLRAAITRARTTIRALRNEAIHAAR